MTLEQALAEFLTYLGLEKNASDKTVKSYREDLTQALAFARDRLKKGHIDPVDWTTRLCAPTSPGSTRRNTPNPPSPAASPPSVRSANFSAGRWS